MIRYDTLILSNIQRYLYKCTEVWIRWSPHSPMHLVPNLHVHEVASSKLLFHMMTEQPNHGLVQLLGCLKKLFVRPRCFSFFASSPCFACCPMCPWNLFSSSTAAMHPNHLNRYPCTWQATIMKGNRPNGFFVRNSTHWFERSRSLDDAWCFFVCFMGSESDSVIQTPPMGFFRIDKQLLKQNFFGKAESHVAPAGEWVQQELGTERISCPQHYEKVFLVDLAWFLLFKDHSWPRE